MELKDYFRILRRRWLTVIVVFVLVFGGLGYWILIWRKPLPVYESSVQFRVEQPDPTFILNPMAPWLYSRVTAEANLGLLKSEPLLRQVVADMHRRALQGRIPEYFPKVFENPDYEVPADRSSRAPGGDEEDQFGEERVSGAARGMLPSTYMHYEGDPYNSDEMYRATRGLGSQLAVKQEEFTKFISVTVVGKDPARVMHIAETIPYSFRKYLRADSQERFEVTEGQLQSERTIAIGKRARVAGELKEARAEEEPEPSDRGGLVELRALRESLGSRIIAQKERIAELTLELAQAQKWLRDGEFPGEQQEVRKVYDRLKARLEGLELQLEEAKRKYKDKHPVVQALEEELARERRRMAEKREEARKSVRASERFTQSRRAEELRATIELLGGQRDELKEELEAIQEQIVRLLNPEDRPQDESDDADREEGEEPLSPEVLEAELEGLQNTVTEIDRTLWSLKLQAGARPAVRVVSTPRRGAPRPMPQQMSIFFLFLISGFVSIGAAYLQEYMTTTIRSEHDVRRYVNLPLLGAVIRIAEEDQRLLINVPPKQPLHEVFNTIGTLVEAYAVENKANVFMVASSKPEEGKSTISSNLGTALAKGGDRVLLIDCDLRKAVLHRFFGVDNTTGLSNLLLSRQERAAGNLEVPEITLSEVLKPTEVEDLKVIPAGPHPQNPVALLKSDMFKQLMLEVREQADLILVDVPPINLAVDTMVLAPLVDAIILLVSAGETNKEEVTHAKRMVESARGKFLGCILNKVPRISRGYYYYYHYYYDTYKYYRER